MPLNPPLEAIFFDLDGTLLNTAADLLDACNQTLQEHQRLPVELTEFQYWIHGGSSMMICESFQIDAQHPDLPKLKSAFLHHYQQRLTQKTQLYAGIDQVIDYLEQQQIPWGIVTNKLTWLTQPITDYFGFTSRCCGIICGDTVATAKPHPAPLLHACQLAQATPQRSLYVGDTEGDIQAAKAAGMQSLAVGYGYRPKNSRIENWQADAVASTPEELYTLLCHPRAGGDPFLPIP